MTLLTSLDEIPEFKKDNVHVRDKTELLGKINRIVNDGHTKLQLVTDFDHTLTRHNMDNGKIVLTSFGMFRECQSIPQYYRDEDNRLSAIYKPIECDPKMSIDEKIKHMEDWYIAAHQILKGIKFPRLELMDVANKMVECFRKGVSEVMSWSERRRVPLLVFSAGLGECVVAALAAARYLLPHVKVVSNFLELDEGDHVIGIKGTVIHTYNKNEAAIKDTEYYDMVRDRSNVILMGDNIGDAGMADGMDHCDVLIKVGFLGNTLEGNLQNYLKKFDIVLVNDPTMDVTNAILKLML